MTDAQTPTRFTGPIVLVFGRTGVGKSSFINHPTHSNFAVAQNATGTTVTPQSTLITIEGVEVAFVDTPGFGQLNRTDAQIVYDVTAWIDGNLGGRQKAMAVIYLYSTNRDPTDEFPVENLHMFPDLDPNHKMRKVGLGSTHWDLMPPPIALFRESYLKAQPWNSMIRQDAGVYRLQNDHHSAYVMAKRSLQAQPAFRSQRREVKMRLANQQLAIRVAEPTQWIENLTGDIEQFTARIKDMERRLEVRPIMPELRNTLEDEVAQLRLELGYHLLDRSRSPRTRPATWAEIVWELVRKYGFSIFLGLVETRNQPVRSSIDPGSD